VAADDLHDWRLKTSLGNGWRSLINIPHHRHRDVRHDLYGSDVL
jgi:hypothetical protein